MFKTFFLNFYNLLDEKKFNSFLAEAELQNNSQIQNAIVDYYLYDNSRGNAILVSSSSFELKEDFISYTNFVLDQTETNSIYIYRIYYLYGAKFKSQILVFQPLIYNQQIIAINLSSILQDKELIKKIKHLKGLPDLIKDYLLLE